jgi:hypothetical protein
MADKQGAIRHAEAPASVVEGRAAAGERVAAEDLEAVAGIGNRSFVILLKACEI